MKEESYIYMYTDRQREKERKNICEVIGSVCVYACECHVVSLKLRSWFAQGVSPLRECVMSCYYFLQMGKQESKRVFMPFPFIPLIIMPPSRL